MALIDRPSGNPLTTRIVFAAFSDQISRDDKTRGMELRKISLKYEGKCEVWSLDFGGRDGILGDG
jgi:hypothetical protein